jgi:acyl transferase domain-containing protein
VEEEAVMSGKYWKQQVRARVRYGAAAARLGSLGMRVGLEVGPGTTLIGLGRESWAEGQWAATLRRDRGEWAQMLESAGRLWVCGVPLRWAAMEGERKRRRVPLPTHPFERRRCWLSNPANPLNRHSSDQSNPLIPRRVAAAGSDWIRFETQFAAITPPPSIGDHRMSDVPIVPASTWLTLAIAAIEQEGLGLPCCLKDVQFLQPLALEGDGSQTVQILLESAGTRRRFEIHSLSRKGGSGTCDTWTLHATGTIVPGSQQPVTRPQETDPAGLACGSADDYYRRLEEKGFQLGPSFRWLGAGYRSGEIAVRALQNPSSAYNAARVNDLPGLLDGCMHTFLSCCGDLDAWLDGSRIPVPSRIESLSLLRLPEGSDLSCQARLSSGGPLADASTLDFHLLDGSEIPVIEARGLTLSRVDSRRLRAAGTTRLTDALYRISWQRTTAEPAEESELDGRGCWLLFDRDHPEIAALRAELDRRNCSYRIVTPASGLGLLNDLLATIDRSGKPLAGVIYGWSAAPAASVASESSLPDRVRSVTTDLLDLLQVLSTRANPAQLYVLTRGAQAVSEGGAVAHAADAAAWGMARVAAQELHPLHPRLIDLDPRPGSTHDSLVRELRIGTGSEVTYRDGQRYEARLVRLPSTGPGGLRFAEDRTYLVTGATGGIGAEVARFLAARGAKHLALSSRNIAGPAGNALVSELSGSGAQVEAIPADVGALQDVRALIARIRDTMPPLAGVLHTAGAIDDAVFEKQSPSRFDAVLKPKVDGAWNLHTALESAPLDFFVCFSSASALLGTPGQANYAAANACMDGLMAFRRARGLAGLAIDWGPWSEVGMAARLLASPGAAASYEAVSLISPADGIQILDRLMTGHEGQVAVLPVEWQRFPRRGSALPPALIRDLIPITAVTPGDKPSKPGLATASLQASSLIERREAVLAYVRECVTCCLGQSGDAVGQEIRLTDAGIDSLMAMEMRRRILRDLRVDIPVARLLEGPTLVQLAEEVSVAVESQSLVATTSANGATPRRMRRIDTRKIPAVAGTRQPQAGAAGAS